MDMQWPQMDVPPKRQGRARLGGVLRFSLASCPRYKSCPNEVNEPNERFFQAEDDRRTVSWASCREQERGGQRKTRWPSEKSYWKGLPWNVGATATDSACRLGRRDEQLHGLDDGAFWPRVGLVFSESLRHQLQALFSLLPQSDVATALAFCDCQKNASMTSVCSPFMAVGAHKDYSSTLHTRSVCEP